MGDNTCGFAWTFIQNAVPLYKVNLQCNTPTDTTQVKGNVGVVSDSGHAAQPSAHGGVGSGSRHAAHGLGSVRRGRVRRDKPCAVVTPYRDTRQRHGSARSSAQPSSAEQVVMQVSVLNISKDY